MWSNEFPVATLIKYIMTHPKVCWITGASSGIGQAVALLLAAKGEIVILSARRELELDKVKSTCIADGADAKNIVVLPLDITDIEAIPDTVAKVMNQFGRIDLLFNNAGISQRSTCLETSLATYRKLFEVDVFGQIALTQQVLPIMVKQQSGHIAVTSSVAGKIGVANRTGYCAAKHAMMGFFDALRAEVTHKGIAVSTIVPGFIRTNLSHNALVGDGSNLGKMDDDIATGMNVTDAAHVIVNGLEKRKKEISVGKGVEMHALWLKRFLPAVLFKLMAKRGAIEAKK